MRICHVVGDSRFGGGSRVVLDLAAAALAAGYDVDVVGTDPLFVTQIRAAGARPVVDVGIRRELRPIADLAAVAGLVRLFRRERYDLVHTHTSKAGVLGRLAARLAGVPAIVHTVHGFAFHERSRPAAVGLVVAVERIAAHWCDRVVTVSRYHRDRALALGIAPARKLVAIPNGIADPGAEPDFDRDAFRSSLDVGPGAALLVAIGRLAPQKGFRYLVEAADLLSRRNVGPLRVLIAGEGKLRPELERRIAAAGLGETVSLLGFRSDIDAIYRAADLVVQPSLWEGLSISLLEAMARGCAVVTTDIGSNREVVGDSGAVAMVPCADPRALADAVAALVGDPERRRLQGKTALEVFRSGYTCERMQAAYLALYAELRDGRKGTA